MSDSVYVVAANRTPMGSLGGSLSGLTAAQLGAASIKQLITSTALDAQAIDEVYMGNVLSAGVGQAPARQAALYAGLPNSVPTTTVNKVCGSGMKSVMLGASNIANGEADLVVAGGMESMSNAPYMLPKARSGMRMGHGEVIDHMFLDGLQDAYTGSLMGVYAQQTSDARNLTRESMDDFALSSLFKAKQAQQDGNFSQEIVPVEVKHRKGSVLVNEDEQPGLARPEKVRELRPAFAKQGTITAANASSISDGASALLLASATALAEHDLQPLAQIKGMASFGCRPEDFTLAPVGAVEKLLNKLNWSVDSVDLFEMNEAFAMVPILAMADLSIPEEKVNVHGGACALGHPLGSSGSRIIVTLIHALKQRGLSRGIATLCIGGGESTAIAVEV